MKPLPFVFGTSTHVLRRKLYHRSKAGRCITAGRQEETVSCWLHIPITSSLTKHLGASCGTDPLVHHGRHFGRTVHALCTISALINNGILRMGELAEQPDATFTRECVFSSSSLIISIYLITQRTTRASSISEASPDGSRTRGTVSGRLRRERSQHRGTSMFYFHGSDFRADSLCSYRRALQVQDLMTQKP